MSFLMTATPLQMHTMSGFSMADTAWVIQSHIIGMYLPSLFSGILVERLGIRTMMSIGLACLFATVGIGLVSRELLHYWGALVLLGVGWNFLFVSGTVLLTRSYFPSERFKAQAVNDFSVFGIQAFTSLAAGTVLFTTNWGTLNLLNIPALLLMVGALIYLGRNQIVLGIHAPASD
jgi:MFS family permease